MVEIRQSSYLWQNVKLNRIQAISKRLRGKPDATDNLAEEMADVTICLYLLQEMYGITDEQLEEWIARKTARQSKRMQADDPFMEGEDVK